MIAPSPMVTPGMITASRPIQVHVSARREAGSLVVEVANTGRWVQPGSRQSMGTGLHSLARRLRLLVGPAATVSHREVDGWVRVRITVPLPAEAVPRIDTEAAR